MGVIVKDTISTDIGIDVTDVYGSFGTSDIRLTRKDPRRNESTLKYELEGVITLWKDEDARKNDKRSLSGERVVITGDTPPTGNYYELLYAKYKESHTCVDC